jgi:2'-5' RNA ligase
MQLLAVIVPPPEVVRDALEAAQALCSTEPATKDEPGRGLLDRIRGRRGGASRNAPSVALHPLSSDAVFVRLAKFGNVTGDDVEGLARALTAVAGTWPAPVLRTTGVSVAESEPHTVTAQLGGDVDALRDIYGNVNEVARQQRFFLDRRSFRSELVVGSVEGQDGATVPLTLLGAEAPHAGPSWSPAHVTLVRASFGASGATYSEHAQVELAHPAAELGTGTGD